MRTILHSALAIGIVAGLACGDGGGGPSGLKPSTEYHGVITGNDGTSAGLVLTFTESVSLNALPAGGAIAYAAVPAAGLIIVPGQDPISLEGTLDGSALSMTGGGFTLTGTLKNGKLTGDVTGPGDLAGSFAALSSTEAAPAYAYCGTYSGIITPGNIEEDGTFNLVVAGSILSGGSSSSGGDIVTFTGRAAAGTNGTTTITVNQSSAQGTVKADGTISADHSTIGGTFQASVAGEGGVNNGTFEGTRCPGTVPTLRE